MLKTLQLCLTVLFGLLATAPAHAQQAAKPADSNVMATVNGAKIPQSRLDFIMRERGSQGQPDSPEVRKNAREDLINREILVQEAVKKGLDRNPDIATQLDLSRQQVLVRAYLQDYIKANPISDDAMKQEFEQIKSQLGDREFKARHVLVDNEAEAENIISQIKKGTKFDKIASEKSKDLGTKSKGGELDWSPAGNYVKPFAEALVKLQKGQFTQEPVQSQFGWHVIRLDDVRPLKLPAFEEVKTTMQQRLQQKQIDVAINELRAKAKVE